MSLFDPDVKKLEKSQDLKTLLWICSDTNSKQYVEAKLAIHKITLKLLDNLVNDVSSSNQLVANSAIKIYKKTADFSPLDFYIEKLQTEDMNVCVTAANALDLLNWQPDKVTDSSILYWVLIGNKQKCQENSKLTAQTIRNILPKVNRDLAQEIVESIRLILEQEDAGKLLSELITVDIVTVRANAALELSFIKYEKAQPYLLSALKNEQNKQVRQWLIYTLGRLNTTEAAPLLNDMLVTESDSLLKKFIVEALGNIGNDKSIPVLMNAYEHDDFSLVNEEIIKSLGKIGSIKSENFLITLVNDENANLSRSAVEALRKIKSVKAVEPLIQAFKSSNKYALSNEIINTLGKLKDKRAVKFLLNTIYKEIKEPLFIDELCSALYLIGDKSISKELELILDNPNINSHVREQVEWLWKWSIEND